MTPELVAPVSWRAIDFISDLHLSESAPKTFDAWAAHMARTPADCVLILGDLFEAWLGDDMAASGFEARCAGVLERAAARIRVGVMVGNRDFLIGAGWLGSLGVVRLADPTVVAAFGERALVMHGDALCLDDTAYQRFRSVVRRRAVQRAFLTMPLAWRRTVGRAIRGRSSRGGMPAGRDGRTPIDLDREGTQRAAEAANARFVVHGHTHAPATHAAAAGVTRFVLSDWDTDLASKPRAEVLRWNRSGFSRIAPERAT